MFLLSFQRQNNVYVLCVQRENYKKAVWCSGLKSFSSNLNTFTDLNFKN